MASLLNHITEKQQITLLSYAFICFDGWCIREVPSKLPVVLVEFCRELFCIHEKVLEHPTWLAGISPFLIGNTSSFRVHFPATAMLDDPGVDNHPSFYTELPTLHIAPSRRQVFRP